MLMNNVVIDIVYDPFHVSTTVRINGEEVADDSDIHRLCRERRLQEWVDDFLPLVHKKTASRKIDFIFKGLPLDAADLESAIDEYTKVTKGAEFCLKSIVPPEGPEGSRVAAIRDLYETAKKGPCKELFVKDMAKPFEMALDPTFEVNVLGTMSSGKSMLINAMLGQKLLFSDPESATSAITRIEQTDDVAFRARRFDANGKVLDRWRKADENLLKKWTSVKADPRQTRSLAYVQIQGEFPAIPGKEESRLVIVDTPGPNTVIHLEHGNITAEVIRRASSSMVLYVLNASQLFTKDDAGLLVDVCTAMEKGGRRTRDQFVFLVNKIDERMTKDGAVLAALGNVRKYLADRGIRNPIVVPCSAQLALFARLKKNGVELDKYEEQRWNGLKGLFELVKQEDFISQLKGCVDSACLERVRERLELADDLTKLEILSGIPVVEEILRDYLDKYAVPTRVKEAVEAFEVLDRKMDVVKEYVKQLEKSDDAFKEAEKKINDFAGEKGRVASGLDFQKQLDSWEYKLSRDANEKLNECANRATQTADAWVSKFNKKGDIGVDEAKELVAKATNECSCADAEVVQELGREIDKEFRRVFEAFSRQYKEYIEGVLKKRFPGDPSIQQLKEGVLRLPSVEVFINENKYEHRYQVSDGYKYAPDLSFNPLTLFGLIRFVPVMKNVTESRVDLSTDESQHFLEDLRTVTLKNIEQFKQAAMHNSEKARQTFVKALATVQSRLSELATELKKARASKASKARSLKIAHEKLKWYEQFRQDVEFILAV